MSLMQAEQCSLANIFIPPWTSLWNWPPRSVAGHSVNGQRMERNGPSSLLFEHDPRHSDQSNASILSLRVCTIRADDSPRGTTPFRSWFHCSPTFFFLSSLDLSYKLGCQPVCRLLRGGDRLYHLYTRVDVDFDSQGFTSIPSHGGNGSSLTHLILTARCFSYFFFFLFWTIYDIQVGSFFFFLCNRGSFTLRLKIIFILEIRQEN